MHLCTVREGSYVVCGVTCAAVATSAQYSKLYEGVAGLAVLPVGLLCPYL